MSFQNRDFNADRVLIFPYIEITWHFFSIRPNYKSYHHWKTTTFYNYTSSGLEMENIHIKFCRAPGEKRMLTAVHSPCWGPRLQLCLEANLCLSHKDLRAPCGHGGKAREDHEVTPCSPQTTSLKTFSLSKNSARAISNSLFPSMIIHRRHFPVIAVNKKIV